MATCQCAGGDCTCEAIQVPPKLGFLKKHDRPVNGFVAWIAVLNMALIAALPIAMSAQELDSPPPPEPPPIGMEYAGLERLP